jgi:hypothetical protein
MPFLMVVLVVVCDWTLAVGLTVCKPAALRAAFAGEAAFNDLSDIKLELEPFRFTFFVAFDGVVVSALFATFDWGGDVDRGGGVAVLLTFSSSSVINIAASPITLPPRLFIVLALVFAAYFGDGGSASGSIKSRLESNNCFSARLINAETAFCGDFAAIPTAASMDTSSLESLFGLSFPPPNTISSLPSNGSDL